MKKMNCPVSGKLNPSFSSAEITRIRRTENLNLKQKVNQSTPEVLPEVLPTNVDRICYEIQPASQLLNKLFVKVKPENFANWFEKYFPLDKNFDSVTVSQIIPDVREKQLVIGINK